MHRTLFSILMAAFLVIGLASNALAYTPVARISLIQGEASLLRGDYNEWVAASINTPFMAGDRIYSGDQSRMEITLAPGQFLRLASNTSAEILNFTPALIQIKLAVGTATLFAKRLDQDRTLEIDTPNVAITVLKGGLYRVDVNEDGNTSISVWKGQVEAAGNGGKLFVRAGQRAFIKGTYDPLYEMNIVSAEDAWDLWNIDRNRRLERTQLSGYVNEEIYGIEDLDEYGRWVSVPTYGRAWVPAGVGPDWVPYSQGRWIWQDPFGWTWVSYEPWGWAPYHYGRWAHFPGIGWGWVAQPRYINPYYAPALVSFIWSDPHVSIAISAGNAISTPFLGWFPLSPRDVYVPYYAGTHYATRRVGLSVVTPGLAFSFYFSDKTPYYYNAGFGGIPAYRVPSTTIINQYNYTTINNISVTKNVYINRTVQNAVVTTTPEGFRRGVVERVKIDAREIEKAVVVHEVLPVIPTRDSLSPSEREHHRRPIRSEEILKRQVVAINAPAPVPTPFEEKIKEIEANKAEPVLPFRARKTRGERDIRSAQATDTGLQRVAPTEMAKEPEAGDRPLLRDDRIRLRDKQSIPISVEGGMATRKNAQMWTAISPTGQVKTPDKGGSGQTLRPQRRGGRISEPVAREERLERPGRESNLGREEKIRSQRPVGKTPSPMATIEKPKEEPVRNQLGTSDKEGERGRLSRESRRIDQIPPVNMPSSAERQQPGMGAEVPTQPFTGQLQQGQTESRSERYNERGRRLRPIERSREPLGLQRPDVQQVPPANIVVPEGRIRPDAASQNKANQSEQVPSLNRQDNSINKDSRPGRRDGETSSLSGQQSRLEKNQRDDSRPGDQVKDEDDPSNDRSSRRNRFRQP